MINDPLASPGSIDVNIMTKLDKDNFRNKEKLPPEFAAHAVIPDDPRSIDPALVEDRRAAYLALAELALEFEAQLGLALEVNDPRVRRSRHLAESQIGAGAGDRCPR